MKHSAFVSKIEKSNQKNNKRRRGSKKLQTRLEGLVDALPEIESTQKQKQESDDDDWEGMSEDEEAPAIATAIDAAGGNSNEKDMLSALAGMVNVRSSIKKTLDGGQGKKMEMKTLKSNRGRAKRKARLEGTEMERFGRNLAEMSKPVVAAQGAGAVAGDRWAALRGFIGQTTKRNPNFGKAA